MNDWFLEIWEGDKGTPDFKAGQVIRFMSCEDAWTYVIKHAVKHYCLFKGECVVDCT